jgi:hypothetical protein
VPHNTIRRRLAGTPARRDCIANWKKLTEQEEDDLRKHLLALDSRGFGPTLKGVVDMANHLLASRSGIVLALTGLPTLLTERKTSKCDTSESTAINELPAKILGILGAGLSLCK